MPTTFDSAGDLKEAPDWYAEYMVREQTGEELPL